VVPALNREPPAGFACQEGHPRARTKQEPSTGEMLRDEGPFQSNHPESDKTAAHAVREGFRPNEPRRVLPGHVRRLDLSLAFRLKNPQYFSGRLQGGLFCYPLRLHGRARPQKAGPSKSGRFWRNEPEGDPSRTPMQTWPERTQPDLAEPARWRDELEPRQRADGNICDCRRVVPQSFLPFSANEANLRERSQRGKAKRTNAPR
jgi:hypothetical protein